MKMKRKREEKKEKIKKRRTELNKNEAEKILFKNYIKDNPLESKRYSCYKGSIFKNQQIRFLIKNYNVNENNIRIIKKLLKEYVGFLVCKTKNEMEEARTITPDFLKNVIEKQISNGDILLNKK